MKPIVKKIRKENNDFQRIEVLKGIGKRETGTSNSLLRVKPINFAIETIGKLSLLHTPGKYPYPIGQRECYQILRLKHILNCRLG